MTDQVPEWVATLVGTLVLQNTALQRQIADRAKASPEPPAMPMYDGCPPGVTPV